MWLPRPQQLSPQRGQQGGVPGLGGGAGSGLGLWIVVLVARLVTGGQVTVWLLLFTHCWGIFLTDSGEPPSAALNSGLQVNCGGRLPGER